MLANRRNLFLAAIASLTVCSVAQANSIAPFVWFWPGVLHVALAYSFPATLLAAVIEGDFIRRRGERHGNLVLSLRANLLSTLVGILLVPISQTAMYMPDAILWWTAACFAISCVIELLYLKRVDRSIVTSRVVVGNAISAATLVVIPWIAEAVKEARPEWAWSLRDDETSMLAIAFLVSAGALVGAWFVPVRRTAKIASPEEAKTAAADSTEFAASRSEADREPQLASSK